MQKAYTKINWKNSPNTSTPLGESELVPMDASIDEIDDRVVAFDTTKANQSDLLTCLSGVTYDSSTGVFVFTFKNGNTVTADLNIEKIPVSFSMDAYGVITMTTSDGTQYTADVGALIKTYTFSDSSEIDFTETVDGSGNKTVTASLVPGSIDGTKLTPNYLADAQAARTGAQTAATRAESWAEGGTGTRAGEDTNNSKYWAQQAQLHSSKHTIEKADGTDMTTRQNLQFIGATITDDSTNDRTVVTIQGGGHTIEDPSGTSMTQRQTLQFKGATVTDDSVNNRTVVECQGGGLLPHLVITADTGETVTATKGGTTLTATETSTGIYEVDVTSYGTWTVSDGTNSNTVNVDSVKVYEVAVVSVPDGSTVTPTDDISIWLACGQRSETYTTLAEVLADSTCLSALMADSNAVDYLVRSTTWISGVCADSSAMTYIGLNNYASNTLLADSDWCAGICNSAYFESVLNVKVPTMTSATTPSGEVFGSGTVSANPEWLAFDNDNSTYVVATFGVQTFDIGYKFTSAKKVYMAVVTNRSAASKNIKTFVVQGGTNKANYTDVSDSLQNQNDASISTKYLINPSTYDTFRLHCTASWDTPGDANYTYIVAGIQFYGREDV